jgi:hypothetical protein
MTRIAELYGLPTGTEPAGSSWAEVAKEQRCPSLSGAKCLKGRKSQPNITIGTCTLITGEAGRVMICPFRLLERNQIFLDCQHLLTLHEPGNEWHIVRELEVPGGSVDYCLASVRGMRVMDFVGIELQTLDTTGTVWPERQRFLHDHGVKVKAADRNSRKSFGVNWKMTAKTTFMQLHHKIQTFEHLSKKLVLVFQDHLLEYMREAFSLGHLSRPHRLGDAMQFHAYRLEERDNGFRLQLAEQLSTDAAGIATCLGLQADAKVELEAITRKIESKLSHETLLRLEAPPPPTSLIRDARE